MGEVGKKVKGRGRGVKEMGEERRGRGGAGRINYSVLMISANSNRDR